QLLRRPRDASAPRWRRSDRVSILSLRRCARREREPERIGGRYRWHLQRGAQCSRPDAAPRARGGPASGGQRRQALLRRPGGGARMSGKGKSQRVNEPQISEEVVAQHGLSPEEYRRVLDILGREPNLPELGIFSVMWSEHCSYKSSKRWLKTLPTTAPWVICGPGENAGVIDIGDGLAAIFKMESHNHPSF